MSYCFRQRKLGLASHWCVCTSKISIAKRTEACEFCGTVFWVGVYLCISIRSYACYIISQGLFWGWVAVLYSAQKSRNAVYVILSSLNILSNRNVIRASMFCNSICIKNSKKNIIKMDVHQKRHWICSSANTAFCSVMIKQ